MTEEDNQVPAESGPEFAILRIYLKDVSFETPNSPGVFAQEFKPEISLQLNTAIKKIENDIYEVVLSITVTAKQGEQTGFLVEVQQAGLFTLKGFDEAQKGPMLGAYCPNTLFPYAREEISGLVSKGGFPPVLLSPINFDMIYAEKAAENAQPAASAS
ncbi:MAG TPA: protein-export chaperone SecB [Gammaproteobacteria bacterium]|nr:protein-export chaperone SecB [Gammaproteobacteria bacterium]